MFVLMSMCCDTAEALVFLLGVNVLRHSPSLGVRSGVNVLVFVLVSVRCDTAQALVFLLVSVCCDTSQALVFVLMSVCCDTAQALVFVLVSMYLCLCWCQCVDVCAGVNMW